MRAAIGLALCALSGACLHLPPAIDEDSVVAHAEPAPAGSTSPTPAPTPAPAPAPVPTVATPIPETHCPVATGRHTFCEGRRICNRDARGCEKCVCNTELDSGRAAFEAMDPWDMRQR